MPLRGFWNIYSLSWCLVEFRTPWQKVAVRVDIASRTAWGVLLQGKSYLDWLPYDKTVELARTFLKDGLPFTVLADGDRSKTKQCMLVRNAIAHRSRFAKRQFEEKVIGDLNLPSRERTPAGYLRSIVRVNPTFVRFQIWSSDLADMALRIAECGSGKIGDLRQPPSLNHLPDKPARSRTQIMPKSPFIDNTTMKNLQTLHWVGGVDGRLRLIDQTRLPVEFVEIECRDVQAVWEAIKMLRVRGARPSASPRPTACVSACKTSSAAMRPRSSAACTKRPTTWPPAARRPSTSSGRWSG